ncbi:MAG TPA: ABC transporter ATP-binding protein [Verrucomicrobiae bacterium]|nr:ABC transporter ATP-binding protein [Verrucomicrobiae bacterium]
MTSLAAGERPDAAPALLSLAGIGKSFDGRQVLDDACLDIAAGEVHALLGENGAGKSTLMNVLTGVYAPDRGEIRLDGRLLPIRGPRDAIAAGIGMVHQHFRLVDRFSAAENLWLSAGSNGALATPKAAAAALESTARELGLGVDPDAIVGQLSIAERQRVEICKVLALGARIVVLDEPTAVLTDQEAESLLAAVRSIAAAGRSVVLITHKLREVVGHSDRVTVMRQGRTVAANRPTAALDAAGLARLMVGEEIETGRPMAAAAVGRARLAITGLSVRRGDGAVGIEDVSLSVRGGEILGIAGVGGNGQQQLADALAGIAQVQSGTLAIDDEDVTTAIVARRRDLGLRIIPADRSASGVVGDLSVAENLALTRVRIGRYGRVWLQRGRMRDDAARTIKEYDVAGAAPGRPMRLLSGGNAQKLLLARELDAGVSILLAHSPARGLDVKATAFVQVAIRRAVAAGAACLLISEDLEEILALSDRIAVMSRGRIVAECPAGVSSGEIGALMLGHA